MALAPKSIKSLISKVKLSLDEEFTSITDLKAAGEALQELVKILEDSSLCQHLFENLNEIFIGEDEVPFTPVDVLGALFSNLPDNFSALSKKGTFQDAVLDSLNRIFTKGVSIKEVYEDSSPPAEVHELLESIISLGPFIEKLKGTTDSKAKADKPKSKSSDIGLKADSNDNYEQKASVDSASKSNEDLIKVAAKMDHIQKLRKADPNAATGWFQQEKELKTKDSELRRDLDEIEKRINKADVKEVNDIVLVSAIARHLANCGVKHPGILTATANWFNKLSVGSFNPSLEEVLGFAQLFVEHRLPSPPAEKIFRLAEKAIRTDTKRGSEVYAIQLNNLCHSLGILADEFTAPQNKTPCFVNFVCELHTALSKHPLSNMERVYKSGPKKNKLTKEFKAQRKKTPDSAIRDFFFIYDLNRYKLTRRKFNFDFTVATNFTYFKKEKFFKGKSSLMEHEFVEAVCNNVLKTKTFKPESREYDCGSFLLYREKLIAPFHCDAILIKKNTACIVLEPGGEAFHHNLVLMSDGHCLYELGGSSAFKSKYLTKQKYSELPIRVITLCQSELEPFSASRKISPEDLNISSKLRCSEYGKFLHQVLIPKALQGEAQGSTLLQYTSANSSHPSLTALSEGTPSPVPSIPPSAPSLPVAPLPALVAVVSAKA